MKQNLFLLVILIVFVGGIATGYGLNSYIAPQDSDSLEQNNAGQKPSGPSNENQPPTVTIGSKEMLEDVLPNVSPAWININTKKIQKHAHQFDPVFSSESVKKILHDFESAMPHGATDTIGFLYQNSEWLELFVLPPEPNQPYRFAAAFPAPKRIEDASEETDTAHPLFAFWKTLYPDIEIADIPNAEVSFQSLQTPVGEYIGFEDDGIVWFSNHMQGFPKLFSAPIKSKTKRSPRQMVMKQYPDAAITVFLNGANEGAEALALPGMIPQLLTQYGIQEAVLAYQIKAKGVQLSIHAPAASVPAWAQTWSPMSSFPFTKEDPMGLLELAFHVPVMSASGEVEMDSETENNMETMSLFPMNIFPQGSVTGLNLFGFYEGIPTLALRFANIDEPDNWIESLKSMPQISTEHIEITNIPAVFYQMQQSPFANILGRDELVVMERDAVTYVFDSPVAGKNYFGELNNDPAGKMRRDIAVREGLQSVEEQAQIKGILTTDWFEQWLVMETKRYQKNPVISSELNALKNDLQPLIRPIHFSAGLREQEWFFDSHAATAEGHLVDLFLLSSMAQSFIPHQ